MLRWPNVDLQHGVIQVIETFDKRTGGTRDGTKSEAPRLVPIPAPLLPLLRAMHRESGGKGRVCPKMFGQPSMARALRTWLRRAGITRPQLFVRSSVNRPIRWHDLRATCGTWLAVQGRSPTEIRDLLGHTKTDMTDRYLRNATAVRGGHFGEVFGPLPEALVGEGSLGWVSDLSETQDRKLSKLLTNVVELTGIETDDETALWVEESALESMSAKNRVCETPAPILDSLEATILSKIADAALAGQTVVVEALTRKLEAHRKGRSSGNVIALRGR
jgi:integrase-like protein